MHDSGLASRWNLDAIESAYTSWKKDPGSVDPSWRLFFEGFELGASPGALAPDRKSQAALDGRDHARIALLVNAYRDLGHLLAHLDPLSEPRRTHPLLEISEFGFDQADLSRTYDTHPFIFRLAPSGAGASRLATLEELLDALRETYCRTIGVESMHIRDTRIRRWLQERMEPCRNYPNFDGQKKQWILKSLHYAELFERFLQSRFVGQKRFSLEGAETLIPLLEAIVENAAVTGVREIVIGMTHRGRLNVLANILRKPYQEIFAEFEENFLPASSDGDGDVKYHLGFSGDRTVEKVSGPFSAAGLGKNLQNIPAEKGPDTFSTIHLSLSPNPSHLELVDPVVEGRTRAKQDYFHDAQGKLGIPLLVHGDAAFAGQGLMAETLNLSQLEGYKTGGTIHVIVNNQIGFTTAPADARSTTYCTDVAKMIDAPIFHVNGEDPEAAVYVAELALEFRQTFNRDVVIDLNCYRRHGHNEGDEPSYTQPLMYGKIKDRPSIAEVYTEQLIMHGDLSAAETEALDEKFHAKLQTALQEVKTGPPRRVGMRGFSGQWKGLVPKYSPTPVETGVALETLRAIVDALTRVPEQFTLHPKIARPLESRRKTIEEGRPVDWSLAEALAFGSLLLEKQPVRLSGQDSRRGTFSQRHAVLFDARTGEPFCPLNTISPDQAPFSAYDSPLSETAVLGFDFGYSLDAPGALVIWEAQFGDFANGAQAIIDQFIVCSQSKWQRDSGLVLLLPHGYEGQGPEHSSARLERFLQLCAEDNIQVCNPTTPAQYFHVLRRQLKRNFRRPLILMTPKSLLRHKAVMSPIEELTTGHYQEVLDDTETDPARVHRLLLCSGKIYYGLREQLAKERNDGMAILRIEQFYPFPGEILARALERYDDASEYVWVQEESMNMGGWSFMEPRLRGLGWPVVYVGRDASASPATASRQIHLHEQAELIRAAVGGAVPHIVRASADESNQGKQPKIIEEEAKAGTTTA
jgi:2-oxoglutarate dehydrogenase E1 component